MASISNSSSSNTLTNFDTFLEVINAGRSGEQALRSDQRATAVLAQRLLDRLRQGPVREGELVAQLVQLSPADEQQVRAIIAKLVDSDFVTRKEDLIALTAFAMKAMSYFKIAG